MIELKQEVVELIRAELASIPEKNHNFRNVHEGLGVLREEYLELEDEMFFGEKRCKETTRRNPFYVNASDHDISTTADGMWKYAIRQEAVQVAAMAIRIIQELT